MKKFIFLLFIFFNWQISFAQEDKNLALAKHYYQTGDYEKAASLFEELLKDDFNNEYFYNSLYQSYIRLNQYADAEKLVQKKIKKNKDNPNYQIDLAYLYSQDNQAEKSEKAYAEVINQLSANTTSIRNVANKFIAIRQYELAASTYEKGKQLLKDDNAFGYELGSLYIRNNENQKAVQTYLQLVDNNISYQNSVQSILSNYLDREEIQDELETQLYGLIQKKNKDVFNEMLIWLFTHQEDYEQAFIQAKALDKRNQEDGGRIMQLANNALKEKQYDAAIDAFTYITEKDENNRYYSTAKSSLINAQKLKITETNNFEQSDIDFLKEEYYQYVDQYGINNESINAIRDLAHLEAYYSHDVPKAIELLNQIIGLQTIKKNTRNEVKLDLGDYYVLADDVWEATLLYSQVDKDEKDSPLGEDARFRNAKLSYYRGEFEWAQAQLSILKGATSELIANNALDLSIFIMDNLGLDTTTTTMQIYADAELLFLQNKPTAAIALLDKILSDYPGHALSDDILMKKATIALHQKDYTKAIQFYEQVLAQHGEDILADNAAFSLGDIYENALGNEEKAMEYYKLIITDYSDSVLLVEARKRFRVLRGDEL